MQDSQSQFETGAGSQFSRKSLSTAWPVDSEL